MKQILFVFMIMVAPSLAHAATGAYVCASAEISGNGDDDAKSVAKTLDSLGCDPSKPVTSVMNPRNDIPIVCCVQK